MLAAPRLQAAPRVLHRESWVEPPAHPHPRCALSFSCLLLGSLASRRILQQLRVYLRGRKLHVFDDRPPNEAVLHGLHVRKRASVLHADTEQLDIQVLIHRVQCPTDGKVCSGGEVRRAELESGE